MTFSLVSDKISPQILYTPNFLLKKIYVSNFANNCKTVYYTNEKYYFLCESVTHLLSI